MCVCVVQMDAVNRSCVVSAHFGSHQVHLVVKFPAQYPNNAAPTFQFVSPTTIPSATKTKIQKVLTLLNAPQHTGSVMDFVLKHVSAQILTDTSLQKVKRNQNCLEPCVRQLVSCLETDMVRTVSSLTGPVKHPVKPPS